MRILFALLALAFPLTGHAKASNNAGKAAHVAADTRKLAGAEEVEVPKDGDPDEVTQNKSEGETEGVVEEAASDACKSGYKRCLVSGGCAGCKAKHKCVPKSQRCGPIPQ